jgi:type VI protein secretion system component Hcp
MSTAANTYTIVPDQIISIPDYNISQDAQNTFGIVVDGISGGMTQGPISNGIPVTNFDLGLQNPSNTGTQAGGMVAGKPSWKNLLIYSPTSIASPNLMYYCSIAKPISKVTLYCITTGTGGTKPTTYLEIALQNAICTSYQTIGGAATTGPIDVYSFAYDNIVLTYTPTSATGQAGSSVNHGYTISSQVAS